jgi:site-specific DNA recombinase
MRAIILARVSDEKQDSNEAQLARIEAYVKDKGLERWKMFELKESSTKGDRKKFQEIIDIIRTSKETIALVVDTVDRLQRGFKESVMFDELRKEGKVELHFYRENLIINKKSNSADILRWDMAVMFAKSYVLQLSDNVKRKYEKMRQDGEITGKPPLGYKSVYDEEGSRTNVIPDDQNRYHIVKAFEEYAKGDVSVVTLADKMYKAGLRGRTNKKVTQAMIFRILNDTFYFGEAYSEIHNLRYEHRYEPLITKALFDKCQEVMMRHNKVPTKYAAKPFIFRGLVVCSRCGGVIGGQLKKGKYVYYSCSGYKSCKREYIKEADLLKQVHAVLESLQLSDEKIEEITDALRKIGESENRFYKTNVKSLRIEHDKYEARIKKMYEDRLDGRITDEMYDNFLREFKEKQAEILSRMQDHSDADEEFYLTANMVLSIAKRALPIFESSEPTEKRQFLGFLLQNCELNGNKLVFSLRSPFNLIANCPDDITRRREWDSNPRGLSTWRFSRPLVSTAHASLRGGLIIPNY